MSGQRKHFILTDEEFAAILEAGKAVPYMVIGGIEPRTPYDNATAAWNKIGIARGFDYNTVEKGFCDHDFTAVTIDPIIKSNNDLTSERGEMSSDPERPPQVYHEGD